MCRILNDEDEDIKEDVLGTPPPFKSQNHYSEPSDSTPQTIGNISSGKPSKLATPFGRRTDKLVVKFSINNKPNTENGEKEDDNENHEDDDIIRKVKPGKRCSLIVHGSGPEIGCRFMHDRIEDRVRKT